MSSSSIDEISFSALKYEIIYFVEIIPSNKVKELGKMLIEAWYMPGETTWESKNHGWMDLLRNLKLLESLISTIANNRASKILIA